MKTFDPTLIVSSFFFYMWNAWSEEECKKTFPQNYRHFWNKWTSLAHNDVYGATEKFYSELSDNNRELLVNRAVAVYKGRKRLTEEEMVQTAPACAPETIAIRLDPNRHPLAFGQKVKELMEMGVVEEASKREVSNMIFDMEVIYEKGQGLFAVEAETMSLYSADISSPYTKNPLNIQ